MRMEQDDSIVFCVDSSAFIDINRYLSRLIPQLLDALDRLFNSGRIVSHITVFDEITTYSKRPDRLSRWIRPRRAFFKDFSLQQAVLVSQIVQRFPTLIHQNKEKDDADPWLIAMILERRANPDLFSASQEMVIVSAESDVIANRLPDACRYYSIRHFDIADFIAANGWRITLNASQNSRHTQSQAEPPSPSAPEC